MDYHSLDFLYACNFPANTRQARRANNSNVCYPPNKLIPNFEMNTRQTANSKAINILQSKNSHQSCVAHRTWQLLQAKKAVTRERLLEKDSPRTVHQLFIFHRDEISGQNPLKWACISSEYNA